jgi:hypothetical protein
VASPENQPTGRAREILPRLGTAAMISGTR